MLFPGGFSDLRNKEQLEFKLEKIIGIEKHAGKGKFSGLRKYPISIQTPMIFLIAY